MLSELLDLLPSHVKVSVLLCVKGGRLNIVRGSFCKEFAVMRSAKQDRETFGKQVLKVSRRLQLRCILR